MKNFILIILSVFFILPCVHSQALQKAIPVDVPVNCPKATSIEKLKRHNYAIYKTSEEDGFKILSYSRNYDGSYVDLFEKNGTVKRAQWYVNKKDEISLICLELEEEYNLKPYHHTEYRSEYVDVDWYYYYYKGNTLIVKTTDDDRLFFRRNRYVIDPHTLTIISNTDAASHIEETENMAKQEKEKTLQKEQQEKEQKRREHEQVERILKNAAKRRREADSIAHVADSIAHVADSIAHVEELKSSYSECRFLFETDEEYVSCIIRKHQTEIDSEIKELILQKLNKISSIVVKGKELYKGNNGIDIKSLCNICTCSNKYTQSIANYTENELEKFISERKALSRAYDKAKKKDPFMKCYKFLVLYIDDK